MHIGTYFDNFKRFKLVAKIVHIVVRERRDMCSEDDGVKFLYTIPAGSLKSAIIIETYIRCKETLHGERFITSRSQDRHYSSGLLQEK